MQVSFTPEFATRLREDLRLNPGNAHNPHGGGNTYQLERSLGEDMLLTSVGWANSYYQEDGDYTDEWGVGWMSQQYQTRFGVGRYTEMVGHPLTDDRAIESYRAPDPQRPELYEAAAATLRDFGTEYWIVGVTVTTVFETAWALRGLQRMLLDFAENPELADRILEIPHRYHLAAAQRLVEMGVDMIWCGDDVGGQAGMVISPEMWRHFFKPRLAEFIATLKGINPQLKVAYHSDGDISPIIPELIEIGLDILNPVQPRCMDVKALKQQYGRNLCYWGTIDEQHTLPFGDPADVRAEILSRLDSFGSSGGLILGPTHHVQLDTPMENFWAMIDTIVKTPFGDAG